MFIEILLVAAGLVLLVAGGDALVRGAVSVASKIGLSPLVIGITIVGFGTSMPELLVSLQAALDGSPDIAVGNIVGSNIANIVLILGVTAAISAIAVEFSSVSRDLAVMIAASAALFVLGLLGHVDRLVGLCLTVALIVYLFTAMRRSDSESAMSAAPVKANVTLASVLVLSGLVALVAGAAMLVNGATGLAVRAGVSEAVVGLTVVAVGTSLPELAASVVAAWRGQSAIAIGNVVGSCIFNILVILGITALVLPLNIADRMAAIDIPIMLGVSVGLAVFLWARNGIGRLAGIGLITLYSGYIWSLV